MTSYVASFLSSSYILRILSVGHVRYSVQYINWCQCWLPIMHDVQDLIRCKWGVQDYVNYYALLSFAKFDLCPYSSPS